MNTNRCRDRKSLPFWAGLASAVALVGACQQPPEPTAPEETTAPISSFDATFAEVTDSGVDFVHNTGAFGEKWLPETMGSGVLVLDYDGDERPDLLFLNGTRFAGKPGDETTPKLYRNQGSWNFVDTTTSSGLDLNRYCLGGAAADLDNDGDTDLFLTCLGTDLLLENRDGVFADVSAASGIHTGYEFGSSAAVLDIDLDGVLDIFAARYVTWTPETDLFCTLDGESKAYCTPESYTGASPRLYRGLGGFKYQDVTEPSGLLTPDAKALGVTTGDFDGDGDLDVAIASDTQPNLLYLNQGDGTFVESGVPSGMAFSETGVARGGMGIDAADFDRTGLPSLMIGNFANEMVALFHNEGNLLFVDVAPTSDLGRETLLSLTFGAFFFDYDLDGWLDVFLANGHLDPEIERVQPNVRYRQPLQLFANRGGSLTRVDEATLGDLVTPIVARGGAYADLDLDGDPDLVVSTNGGPAKLFENRGEHGNWLKVRLIGTASNRDGVGARVRVTTASATVEQTQKIGSSYLSQPETVLTFGLADADAVDEVSVTWPSGKSQVVTQIQAGQTLELIEPTD